MAPVKPGLYASKYEATNLEYNEFLRALEQTGDASLLEKARIHDENWKSVYPENVKLESVYSLDTKYQGYPVVSISQEAAKMFCDWLTEQYNAYPKRDFKKVKFRLPTEAEWLAAAKAGNQSSIFPWSGNFLRDGNGKFHANFRRIDESRQMRIDEAGKIEINTLKPTDKNDSELKYWHHLAPVEVFTANDLGIHNISGNAAEMLAEPGRTRGGSWQSFGYYLRLDSEDEYAGFTEPSPMIGFRYFMEVIEE